MSPALPQNCVLILKTAAQQASKDRSHPPVEVFHLPFEEVWLNLPSNRVGTKQTHKHLSQGKLSEGRHFENSYAIRRFVK